MPGGFLSNERTSEKQVVTKNTSLGSVTNQKTDGLLNTSGRIANAARHSALSANSLFLSGLSELLLFWQYVSTSNDAAASLSEEYTQNRDVLFKELAAMAVGHVCYDLAIQGSLVASHGSESRSVKDAPWSFSRSELMRILVLSFGQDLSMSQRGAIIGLLNTSSGNAVAGLVDWEQYLNLLKMVNDLRSHSCPHVPDSKCMSTVENVANWLIRMDDGKEKIVPGDAGKQIKALEAMLLLRSAAAVSIVAFRKGGISGKARKHCLSFLHRVLRREEKLYDTLVALDTKEVLKTVADSRALRDQAQELLSEIKRGTSEERSPVLSSCVTGQIDAVDATLPGYNSVDNISRSLEENSNIELHDDNYEVVMGISEVLAQVRHLEGCIGLVTNGVPNLSQHKDASEKAKKHATVGKTTVGGRAVNSSTARWEGVRSHRKIVSSVHELLTARRADDEQALLSLVRRLHSEMLNCGNMNVRELSKHNKFYVGSVASRVKSLINDLTSVEDSRVSKQLNALLLYDMRGVFGYYAAGCVTYSVRREAEVLFHELLFGIIVNIAVGHTAENHENMLVNPRMLASFTYLFGNLQHDVMIGAYAALNNAFRKRGQQLPRQLVYLLEAIFDLNCVVKSVDNTSNSCARPPGVTVCTIAQLIAEHYCVSKTKAGDGSASMQPNSAVFSVGLLDVADILLLESVAMWETFKSLVSWPCSSELVAKNCKSGVLDGRKFVLELRKSLRDGKAIDNSSVRKILGSIEGFMETVHGFLKRYSGIEANVDNAASFFNNKAYEFLNKDTGESSGASEEEKCLNLLRFLLCRSCESLKHAHDIVSSRTWKVQGRGELLMNDAADKYFSCDMIGPRSHKSECCIYVGGETCTETQTVGGGTARKNDKAATSLSTVEVSKIEVHVRCTAADHA